MSTLNKMLESVENSCEQSMRAIAIVEDLEEQADELEQFVGAMCASSAPLANDGELKSFRLRSIPALTKTLTGSQNFAKSRSTTRSDLDETKKL